MAEAEEKELVLIHSERRVVTYPKLGSPVETIAVTYSTADLPPRTIWISKAEYSREERDARIRRNIDVRRAQASSVIRV